MPTTLLALAFSLILASIMVAEGAGAWVTLRSRHA